MGKPKVPKVPKIPRNRNYSDGDLVLSRCPKCGSTERGKYFRKQCFELPPSYHYDGRLVTHVTYRFTRCKCGQWRRDRSFENRA